MTARKFSRLAPALVALLAATAAYAPALRPSRQLAGRDLFTLYYPLFHHVADAWHGEASFQRDPLRGAGQAVLPDPLAAVCYPPATACWLGLPFDQAFKAYFLLHTILAGLGAAALSRALGASTRGACLAAVAAVLAGPVLSACRTPNLLAATAWSGFALAGFLRARAQGGRRAAAGAALATALMVLAGGAGILLFLGLVVAVAVPVWERGRPVRTAESYVRIGLATALGLLIAAVHLVPFRTWFPETVRGAIAAQGSIPLSEATQWSLHPLRLLEMIVPVASPHTLSGWAGSLYRPVYESFAPYGRPLHASVHLGLPVVALACVGALRNRRAAGVALGALLLLVTAVQVGDATPVWEALRSLAAPVFGTLRYPAKTILPLAILTAALAGVGLARIPRPRRVPLFAVTCLLLILTPLCDREVLPTLPVEAFHTPPAPAAAIVALEDSEKAPGRYLRLHRVHPPQDADFATIREGHRAELREDLPGLHGVEGLLCYGPFANRRIDAYLGSIRTDPPEFFDRERLRLDACVGHVLDAAGLHHAEVPPRVQVMRGDGELELRVREPERIEVEVDLEEPGRVFLSEAFDPAWSAWTEALHPAAEGGTRRPVVLEPARTLFMAAELPAGRYRLVLSYATRGVWLGAGGTLIGLMILVWLAWRRE